MSQDKFQGLTQMSKLPVLFEAYHDVLAIGREHRIGLLSGIERDPSESAWRGGIDSDRSPSHEQRPCQARGHDPACDSTRKQPGHRTVFMGRVNIGGRCRDAPTGAMNR